MSINDEIVKIAVDSYVKGGKDALEEIIEAFKSVGVPIVTISSLEEWAKKFNENMVKDYVEIFKKEYAKKHA